MPEVFYDSTPVSSQTEEASEVTEEVLWGRKQVDTLCKVLQSEFIVEAESITSFKNYSYNLASDSRATAITEVKRFLHEMRQIEREYKGNNIALFFRKHWEPQGEDFYFILKSIDLAGVRVVRDSHLLTSLTDEQKIDIYLEAY